MSAKNVPTVVVIANDATLAAALGEITRRVWDGRCECVEMTYDMTTAHLTPKLAHSSDFFWLGLLRTYPGGLRAEGVTLGRRLHAKRKRVLIASPLHLPQLRACRSYWDTATGQPIGAKIADMLKHHPGAAAGFDLLVSEFAPLLSVPPQHVE